MFDKFKVTNSIWKMCGTYLHTNNSSCIINDPYLFEGQSKRNLTLPHLRSFYILKKSKSY